MCRDGVMVPGQAMQPQMWLLLSLPPTAWQGAQCRLETPQAWAG
jgi:hypothetical protein